MNMKWTDYIAGIVAAAILIPLIRYTGKALWNLRYTAVEVITLRVPRSRLTQKVRFGILHVRDGTDQQDDKGPLLNKKHWFRWQTESTLQVRLRYRRARGCQFKCFVDHRGVAFNDIKALIEELGFTEVSRAEGKLARAFFLVSGYRTVEASGGIRNNFALPA
ncbi:MAG: hypothetical protein JSV32_00175 [Dehalococcoidia bacterium]|nr:MAG: hypothetical protein JSV32_00175 [Dehalococcoidia bacterium]